MSAILDLPLITEATSDYYRNIYADPDLGPIFKGVNMVVLRTHVSYFIHQLTMFDTPMSPRQMEYLRKVHQPLILRHHITQRHYDLMLGYLTEAMRANGAEELNLEIVQEKLLPLRELFPPAQQSEDGHVEVTEHAGARPGLEPATKGAPAAAKVPAAASPDSSTLLCDQAAHARAHPSTAVKAHGSKRSWVRRVLGAFCAAGPDPSSDGAGACPFPHARAAA